MSNILQIARQNSLLAALPAAALEQLVGQLEPLRLDVRDVLYERNTPIEHVHFVLDGVASLISTAEEGSSVEVATVGNEGMVGLPAFLGAESSPLQAFMQIPGTVLRMHVRALHQQLANADGLLQILHRYTQALLTQIAQSSACNRLHSIAERCARWLLMTHDRVATDEFPLTQDFLAQMLGVRRATVTTAANVLQSARLIEYSRGMIKVLDRVGLEAAACECYEIVEREYQRLLNRTRRH